MKKIISIILTICSLFMLASTASLAAEEQTTIELTIGNPMMTVNGTQKEIDPGNDTVPIIQNERTLLPVRAIVEEIGGTVEWNGDTQEVTLSYSGDEIRLTINSTTAYLNNASQTLDTTPTIINERTMLPIRFIAESFHCTVEWEQETETVTITTAEAIVSPTIVPTTEPTAEPTVTEAPTSTAESEKETSNAVVLYFSATGTTKSLAEKVAAAAAADIYEIVPTVPYTSEDLNYNNDSCRANREINNNERPEIEALTIDLSQYDTIFIGYPLWWGTCPPVIKTLLDTYDFSDKVIMPFCTSGSSGISTSVSYISTEETNADVKTGFRGTADTGDTQIDEWLADNNFEK